MKRLSLTTKKENLRVRQKGAAAVEFAIVISLLVLITGGIIEFGRVLWYYDALTKATRDGARYLSTSAPLPLDISNTSKVKGLVVNAVTQAGLPGFGTGSVDISCNPNCTAPDYVTVATDYSVAFGSWFPIPLPSGPLALTPHTTMRYMCDAVAITSC